MKRIFEDLRYASGWGILGVLVVSALLSIFLITKVISEINYLSQSEPYYNSISVVGEGEVIAIPNIATFNFSVNETAESVEAAQKIATEKINGALDYLKEQGVEEKDIKTTSYNIYPRYEWRYTNAKDVICNGYSCGGQNVLVGYEVTQSIDVKVRDTLKSGELLSGLGSIGITNVSGLNFVMDDPSKLHDEALAKAVEDAKMEAKKLSESLDVKLGRIVGYYEEQGYYPEPYYPMGMGGAEKSAMDASMPPELPTGEQTTKVRVSVTYELE